VQVIELDPSNSHAYHNRGISYDKLGEFELAIADFSKGEGVSAAAALVWSLTVRPVVAAVLELDTHNANAYFNRGSTHDSLGSYDKAIADYTRALEIDREMAASNPGGGAPGPSSIGTTLYRCVQRGVFVCVCVCVCRWELCVVGCRGLRRVSCVVRVCV
jgi:tetratricopeptide (TPR) repeat protein